CRVPKTISVDGQICQSHSQGRGMGFSRNQEEAEPMVVRGGKATDATPKRRDGQAAHGKTGSGKSGTKRQSPRSMQQSVAEGRAVALNTARQKWRIVSL